LGYILCALNFKDISLSTPPTERLELALSVFRSASIQIVIDENDITEESILNQLSQIFNYFKAKKSNPNIQADIQI
jgi:hypothetical protein